MATMRISGFSSGLDIDEIVTNLMTAQKTKLNKLNQSKTKLEWTQEKYREMSSAIVDFRNNKIQQTYNLTSALKAKKSTVTGDTDAVTATATSSASNSTMTVQVKRLATAATVQIDTGITDASKTLEELGLSDQDFVKINGVEIEISDSDTITSIVDKINSNSEANVTAIYDATTGKMSITSDSTGEGTISIGGATDENGDPVDEGLFSSTSVIDGTATSGQNASVIINGLEMEKDSNEFTVNGIKLQLNKETADGEFSTITTTADSEKVLETIKSFISDYNALIDKIRGETAATYDRDYPPLTDDEKEEMTEDEIELWEKTAKTGLLYNDGILTSMLSDLRLTSLASVKTSTGTTLNLQSIGINTGTWDQYGKLVIEDEEKLLAAIEDDPDAVYELFGKNGSDDSATSTSSGIFTRMSEILMTSLNQLAEKAGTSKVSTDLTTAFLENSSMSMSIRDYENRIDNEEDRLERLETAYYKRFTAMETAINNYNTQSSALSSFVSS